VIVNKFIYLAAREAIKSTYPHRLGALVLTKTGKIVSRGHNNRKTNPRLHRLGYFCTHAECDAILHSHGQGNVLLVVRVTNGGELSCAKPCDRCLDFAFSNGIRKVYFTDWNGRIACVDKRGRELLGE
jgi:tRNA(Arg) A34 adenosine deaminase TadA